MNTKLIALMVACMGVFSMGVLMEGNGGSGGEADVPTTEQGEIPTEEGDLDLSDASVNESGLRNVMYYSDWSIWGGQGNYYPQDLPTEYYTHLNYAFLDFDAAGQLMFTDTDAAVGASLNQEGVTWGEANGGILPVLRGERVANPNMKLGVSVGGWSKSGDFATMAGNPTTRATFVSQMMDFLRYTDFDFIDIDWEYPAMVRQPDYVDNSLDEGTPSATAADKDNYISLLTELRQGLDGLSQETGKTYELSVALPMEPVKLEAGIDIPALFDIVDFANIMTYDARGAFDEVSGHHTPLYGNPADPMYDAGFSIDQCVTYLLAQGAVSEKIVIGAAFYSRGWENIENIEVVSGLPALFAPSIATGSTGASNDLPVVSGDGGIAGGIWAYRNFDSLHESYDNLVEYWDDVAKAPYLYNGSAFFTYDNPQSLAEKANYVHENNLGGMISWQASNDKESNVTGQRDELTKAIYVGLFGQESLPEHEVITLGLQRNLTMTETGSGLDFVLSNEELAQETNGVLKALELQYETILFPKIYLEVDDLSLISGGYGSGSVESEGDFVVVNLAEVYENRFVNQGSSVAWSLSFQGEGTIDGVKSVVLAQRNTLNGGDISYQLLYGEKMPVDLPSSLTAGTGGSSGGGTAGTEGTTTDVPVLSDGKPVGTLENPVIWSREEEATGAYAPQSFVSHQGVIYQQVSDGVLWWAEPSATEVGWKAVGTVEGYVPDAPSPWSREGEATGAYTSGVLVTYQGKTYLQVSGDTAWWCEPGSDDTVWQEQ